MTQRKMITTLLGLVVIALGGRVAAQEDHPSVSNIEKHIDDSQYESWMQPYREGPLLAKYSDPQTSTSHSDPALLKVVVIEGDDKPPTADFFGLHRRIVLSGSSVSEDGHLSSFSHNFFGFKGGGGLVLPEADLRQIEQLAFHLPDDHSQLPPKGRRIVIQTAYPRGARVYDRAHLPDEIVQILRLMRMDIKPLPAL